MKTKPGYTGNAKRGAVSHAGCIEIFWCGGLTCSSNARREAIEHCRSSGWYAWKINSAGKPTTRPFGPFDTSKQALQNYEDMGEF